MAKTNPLVSIIIPVWNTSDKIGELIKRLSDQTYQNLEIIAVDDGSTDDSLSVLQKIAESNLCLRVIHRENGGASAARNTGIEAASGKYVIFIDSDDDVAENYVEKLVERAESSDQVALVVIGMQMNKLQNGISVDVHTRPRRKRRQKERRGDYLLWLLLGDGRMHSSVNKIFRLEVIKKYHLRFDEGRNFAEDTKFVLDYLEHTPGEIEFILEPLYIYNFGTETSTVKSSSTIWTNWQRSYTDLKKWVKSVDGEKLHIRTKALLGLVLLRWQISYHRSKKRARISPKAARRR